MNLKKIIIWSLVIITILLDGLYIKTTFFTKFKHYYYALEINDFNRPSVVSILNNERKRYCNSMKQIEFEQLSEEERIIRIICGDEESIEYKGNDALKSKLVNYIRINGIKENK